jgi:hypothetical protein
MKAMYSKASRAVRRPSGTLGSVVISTVGAPWPGLAPALHAKLGHCRALSCGLLILR